jgi:cobalamin biosynthesis protein CobT
MIGWRTTWRLTMPEEDDEALGQMLGDRLKGAKGESDDADGGDGTDAASSESDTESASSEPSDASSPDSTESTQITQSTDSPAESDVEAEAESEGDTVRSRSPFPLYVTPELKGTVQNRFEKFNAQRTLNDEPQVEKHKHFMEGLLRAGLDHPELEEYVLDEFKDS